MNSRCSRRLPCSRVASVGDVDLLACHVTPELVAPLIDAEGFSIELSVDRELSAGDRAALAGPATVLSHPVLARQPLEVKGLVSLDEGEVWVSVFVTGPGRFTDEVAETAEGWFQDLWDALRLGARPGAERLESPAQLLALARACREMDWDDALARAELTAPGAIPVA